MKSQATTPSAREERGAKSRQEILAAAAAAIAEHGYFGMSMRELAKATGKGLSTFYSHFRSKEDVLFELQHNAFETLVETARHTVVTVDEPVTQLYLFVSNHVHYVIEHGDVMRVLIHEATALPARRRAKVRALKEAYFELARDIVRRIYEEGCSGPGADAHGKVDAMELELATYNIFGMLNWVFGWYDAERHGTPADVARSVHRIALCGLVARCPTRGALEQAEKLSAKVQRPSPLRLYNDKGDRS